MKVLKIETLAEKPYPDNYLNVGSQVNVFIKSGDKLHYDGTSVWPDNNMMKSLIEEFVKKVSGLLKVKADIFQEPAKRSDLEGGVFRLESFKGVMGAINDEDGLFANKLYFHLGVQSSCNNRHDRKLVGVKLSTKEMKKQLPVLIRRSMKQIGLVNNPIKKSITPLNDIRTLYNGVVGDDGGNNKQIALLTGGVFRSFENHRSLIERLLEFFNFVFKENELNDVYARGCDDVIRELTFEYKVGEFKFIAFEHSDVPKAHLNVLLLGLDILYRDYIVRGGKDIAIEEIDPQGIVVIEDIEVDMPPIIQRRIIGALKLFFPKVQFFITTNSPIIVQSISKEDGLFDLAKRDWLCKRESGLEDTLKSSFCIENSARSQSYLEIKELTKEFATLKETAKHPSDIERMRTIKSRIAKLMPEVETDPVYAGLLEARIK